MSRNDVLEMVRMTPFRPFKVKLENGSIYRFPQPKFLGASQDGRLLFWFGPKGEVVRIDAERVTEISEGTRL
jgi:hypothetical protein